MASKLHQYFPVGTMLKCVIVSTDSSKHGHSKIRLSINPENVNSSLTSNSVCPNMVISGYITSEEDHGYSVDLGIKGMKGFLLKKMVSGRSLKSPLAPDAPNKIIFVVIHTCKCDYIPCIPN